MLLMILKEALQKLIREGYLVTFHKKNKKQVK